MGRSPLKTSRLALSITELGFSIAALITAVLWFSPIYGVFASDIYALFVTSTSIILCAVFIGLIRLNNHVVAIVELVLFCVWWILWLALAAWYADLMSSWGYFDSSFPSYRYYSALAFFSFCWITWGLFTASVVLIIVDAVRNKTLSSRPMVAAPLGVPSGAFHPSVSIPSPAITSPDSEKV